MEKVRRLALVPPVAALGQGSTFENRSDDELMLLARGGVDEAFSTLIRRHQARSLRLAARYLGETALASDVTQNTFVEIFRGLQQYQGRGKFKSYLWRVLLNQCHMTARGARRERRALEVAAVPDIVDEAQVLSRERRREVETALARLSEKLRSVVLLRYVADLSYDEIAVTLDIPTGTVKRRLFDAMSQLRASMEGA